MLMFIVNGEMTFTEDIPEYEMDDDVEPNEGDSGHEDLQITPCCVIFVKILRILELQNTLLRLK